MPSPPHAHAHAAASSSSASASAAASIASTGTAAASLDHHLNLNTASKPNLSSAAYSTSNPASRSTTPLSQITVGSRKLYQQTYFDSSTSRGPSSPVYTNANKTSHYGGNGTSHITSALNLRPSQSHFLPSSLPRTSSLLPPPRITVNESTSKKSPTLYDPFNAPAVTSSFADPVNSRQLDDSVSPKNTNTRRRDSGKTTHSRSSSLGGLSDGFRNLNRWSISTSSSRASNANPQPHKNRFSRRMSVDSTALFSSQSGPAISPRRLQKSRPSTSSGSPEDQRHPQIPPLATLPPIVSLPSLEHHFDGGVELSPEVTRTGLDNDSVRFWNDSTTTPLENSYLSTATRITPDPTLPIFGPGQSANMPYTEVADPYRERGERGHSRSRSQGLKSSTDTTSSQKNKDRSRQSSQKTMLSKALQKANTAVQLDNALNFEGARTAYCDACDVLHQVLLRTSGDDDRKKLEDICVTYRSRIEELDVLCTGEREDSKELPQRPASNSTASTFHHNDYTLDDSPRRGDTGTTNAHTEAERSQQTQQTIPNYARPTSAARRPLVSRHTPSPSFEAPRYMAPTPTNFSEPYHRSQSAFSQNQNSPRRDRIMQQDLFMEQDYMPQPLSPRRPISPSKPPERASPDVPIRSDFSSQKNRLTPDTAGQRGHQRTGSHESISWLDPIEESGGSTASSVHSRSSSMGIRRKHIRAPSGDTEAEFDAALDDAIEAAYDDGYDQTDSAEDEKFDHVVVDDDDKVAQTLRKVQQARERVREMQRLEDDKERRLRALQDEEQTIPSGGFYDGDDSDEEERILEEMTQGYGIQDFTFGLQDAKTRVPRESDSSEFTSRTWHSSTVSNPPTANTVLSTVAESPGSALPTLLKGQGPVAPPPTQSLPKLPPPRPLSSSGRDSVRDRRLSGANVKQLKIETQKIDAPKVAEPATAGPTVSTADFSVTQPKPAGFIAQQRQALSAGGSRSASAATMRGPSPNPVAVDGLPSTPPVPAVFQDGTGEPHIFRPPALRKNFSSNSLRTMKTRNLSVSNIDEYSDVSPGTPLSNSQFGIINASSTRLPAMPSIPTPVTAAFKERINAGSAAGGFYLFDSDITSPGSPGDINELSEDAPLPLEPCPTDVMLRPFWLMRALYQTLAHPRGGYISNKLFVPRDVWRVKGVRIKNVEEKISQCDLLTAALQKLSRADSEDADAVLEEMQSLEGILEQAQAFLTRRLGNDVGVQSVGTMFRDADGVIEGGAGGQAVPRNNSVSGKGAFSWRRLRSKTSSTGLGTAYERSGLKKESSGGTAAEALALPTLPMTSHPTSKPLKRDIATAQFGGPNAHYMAALARLFDAAQAIDQIARQVEDPGLRHADKTQVGLELCTRHAAEFFGFYICRFVLQDLTLLLDKFIKRGSEWVLI